MRAHDLGAVVRLYNRAVAAIPCNWPLTEAEFAEALLGTGTPVQPRPQARSADRVRRRHRGRGLAKTAESFGHDLLHCYAIHAGEEEAARATWHRMSALCRFTGGPSRHSQQRRRMNFHISGIGTTSPASSEARHTTRVSPRPGAAAAGKDFTALRQH